MKKFYLKKSLALVAFMLLGGASSAWADDTFGATDKGWNEGGNEATTSKRIFDLAPNKTLTLKFTVNNTSKAGDYVGWITIVRNAVLGSGTEYYFMQPSGYGVTEGNWSDDSKNTSKGSWFIYNGNNFNFTTFKDDLIGASVVLSIRRMGPDVCMKTVVTTSEPQNQYSHYFVMSCGDGTQNLKVYFGADQAELTLKSSETTDEVLEGTLVGKLNHTGRLSDHGVIENFTLAPEKSLNLKFKLHSTRLWDWGTWLYEVSGVGELYTLCVGNQNSWNNLKINETITKDKWPSTTMELLEKMDGATIDMTVERSGAKVTMTAVHTPLSGDPFTLTAEITPTQEGFATSDIVIRPLVELGYIDILPVTKTITAAGWATYCSPYALDLEHATNLTDAYIVTGGATGVLTKTSMKDGTVPANTGLLLKADEGTVTIPIVGSSSTDVSGNKLVGVTAETNLAANAGYVLMASPSLGFYQNTNAFTVGANTAYLPANFDTTPAHFSFFSLDDDATGIADVRGKMSDVRGDFFDLQGRKVAQPTKGLYIVNGKKYLVK